MQPLNEFHGHSGPITSIAYHPDGYIATGSDDFTVGVWKQSQGDAGVEVGGAWELQHRLTGFTDAVTCVKVSVGSNDGKQEDEEADHYVLASSRDSSMLLFKIAGGGGSSVGSAQAADEPTTVSAKFLDHASAINACGWNHDSRIIAAGDQDGTIKIWNNLGACRYSFSTHSPAITALKWSPSEMAMVTVGVDGKLKRWDVTTFSCTFTLDASAEHAAAAAEAGGDIGSRSSSSSCQIKCLQISPDGSLAATGDSNGRVLMWDLNEKHVIKDRNWLLSSNGEIFDIAFSPTRYWMVVSGADGLVLFDLELREEVQRYTGTGGTHPLCAVFSDDGTHIYAGYSDQTLRAFKVI